MSIFDYLKPKAKRKNTASEKDAPDEEFILPKLSRGEFPMDAEMFRRLQEEQLRKKYGIRVEKEGYFL